MITLPPGFDVSAFVSSLAAAAIPFVGIALLIAAAVIIFKALRF